MRRQPRRDGVGPGANLVEGTTRHYCCSATSIGKHRGRSVDRRVSNSINRTESYRRKPAQHTAESAVRRDSPAGRVAASGGIT